MLQMTCSELIHDNFSETTPSKFHTVMSSCFAMIIINEQSLLANLVDIFLHGKYLVFAKNVYFYVRGTLIIFN